MKIKVATSFNKPAQQEVEELFEVPVADLKAFFEEHLSKLDYTQRRVLLRKYRK